MPETASTSNLTIVVETGEVVHPCRCGETHRGDYGLYDWAHHNCFHDAPLLSFDDGQFLCPQCGKSFSLEIGGSE